MYFHKLTLENYRNYKQGEISFHHPQSQSSEIANINLLMGNNGSGKTSLLKALCMGLIPELMPRFNPSFLIRRQGNQLAAEQAQITLEYFGSNQTTPASKTTHIHPKRGLYSDSEIDNAIYDEESPELFCVAYGASRWTSIGSQYDVPEARNSKNHARYQRVASLFEENFALMPLSAWMPHLMFKDPQRFGQISDFLNGLLPKELGKIHFLSDGEGILFETPEGAQVPFADLSDGYRSYLSWICDLTYHLAQLHIKPDAFTQVPGAILIDEIDLHLHPKWQRHILQTLSKAFPNFQIIATSHSPLVAGALPARNIFLIGKDKDGFPFVHHPDREVRGLDADQILQTQLFDLESSRTPAYQDAHRQLFDAAIKGDRQAALDLMGIQAEGLSDTTPEKVKA